MSYLDPPRFSFAGTFTATPATINNSTENYPLGTQYNNRPPSAVNPQSVWWNPTGWSFFTVPSATVNCAWLEYGSPILGGDTLVGASIVSIPTGEAPSHQARLVDIDPDQQARSMIVGMALRITTTDGASVTGVVATMNIIDIWGRVQGGSGGGIMTAGCMYQSVLYDLVWEGVESSGSRVLRTLYATSPTALSIKFNVDAYNGILQAPEFSQGRFVGSIGPQLELAPGVSEPLHVLAQRRMYAGGTGVVPPSPLNPAPCQVKGGFLSVDLGNSVPTLPSVANPQLAGEFAELGPVTVGMVEAGAFTPIATLFSTAAEFAAAYRRSAGVYEVALSAAQQEILQRTPLALEIGPLPQALTLKLAPHQVRLVKEGMQVPLEAAPRVATPTVALAENANGGFASFDFNALRMAKGSPAWSAAAQTGTEITSTARVPLFATLFGAPAVGSVLGVQTALNLYQFPNNQGGPDWINNDPPSAITPPPSGWQPPPPPDPNIAQVSIGPGGVGYFELTANSLSQAEIDAVQGNRRALPSQLYLYTHDWSMDTIGLPLTIMVFIDTPGPATPTWRNDVGPIFQQYAQLYPGMKSILDLGDYDTVKANIGRFEMVMNLPMTDPGLMPVTRDLAPVQLQTINRWFFNPLY